MKDEIKLKDMTDFLENVYKNIKEQPILEKELEKERKFINKIKGDNEDEIKEILDNPKILMLSYGNYISLDDYVKLKDCITNLQEELKSANESITWWQNRFNAKNNGFKSTVEELCETTEKLEELELKHKQLKDLDKIQKAYKELQQENEMLKLEIERLNDVLVHKPDEKITLKTNDGQELFIIQSERIDMQEELNKANMELMIKLEYYKSRNEKTIENIDLVIELIKQQPTEDDSWILNKLNGFKYLLNGGDKDE